MNALRLDFVFFYFESKNVGFSSDFQLSPQKVTFSQKGLNCPQNSSKRVQLSSKLITFSIVLQNLNCPPKISIVLQKISTVLQKSQLFQILWTVRKNVAFLSESCKKSEFLRQQRRNREKCTALAKVTLKHPPPMSPTKKSDEPHQDFRWAPSDIEGCLRPFAMSPPMSPTKEPDRLKFARIWTAKWMRWG